MTSTATQQRSHHFTLGQTNGVRRIKRGFTLIELLIALTVTGILAAGIFYYSSGTPAAARNAAGANNAAVISRLIANINAAGGTVSNGATGAGSLDSTSVATIVTGLTTGVTVNGQTFALPPGTTLTSASYTRTGTAPNITVAFTAGSTP